MIQYDFSGVCMHSLILILSSWLLFISCASSQKNKTKSQLYTHPANQHTLPESAEGCPINPDNLPEGLSEEPDSELPGNDDVSMREASETIPGREEDSDPFMAEGNNELIGWEGGPVLPHEGGTLYRGMRLTTRQTLSLGGGIKEIWCNYMYRTEELEPLVSVSEHVAGSDTELYRSIYVSTSEELSVAKHYATDSPRPDQISVVFEIEVAQGRGVDVNASADAAGAENIHMKDTEVLLPWKIKANEITKIHVLHRERNQWIEHKITDN